VTYSDKLRDPRWQRKRLEIMQRDDFTCRNCGAKDKTLNIHHVRYLKGRKPWEYKDFYLVTLCEDCHKEEEQVIQKSGNSTKPPKRKGERAEPMPFEEFRLSDYGKNPNRPTLPSPDIEEEVEVPTTEELDEFFKNLKRQFQESL